MAKRKRQPIKTDNCKIIYNDNSKETFLEALTDAFVSYVNNLYKQPVIEKK